MSQSLLVGGGSRWITNPKQLDRVSVVTSFLNIKTTSSTATSSALAAFFTALALRGAQTSIVSANTYATIVNVTNGSGFLVNCVSPAFTAGHTPTFLITVDGTAYTIAPSAAQPTNHRLVLGPRTSGASIGAIEALSPNGGSDNGFRNANVGGVVQVTAADVAISIPTPDAALSYGYQVLRFESSLRVEVKTDSLSADVIQRQCGATYILDL